MSNAEIYRQMLAGRAEIKRIAETAKSGAVLDKKTVAQAHAVMEQAYDADNRNGMGKLTVSDAMSADRVTQMHELLTSSEQRGIQEGVHRVLVDFSGNVVSEQIAQPNVQEANAK